MITQAELIIIKRYLKPKKKEGILKIISIFSFFGIGLGVATLIIVMSVMNGFRTDLIGKLLLFQPHIVVYQFDNYEKDKDKIKDVLKKNNIKYESIKLAYATQGLVVSKTLNQGTNVRAIKKNDFLLDKLINKNITRGSVENFGNGYVSIGLNFSESLGISIGDKITVLSSAKESTPFGNVPQQFSFTIGSVFESGIYEFDSNYILIDIDTSQDFLQNHENNKNIELKLNDADDAATVKRILEKSKFQSFSWIDNNKSFYDALLVE